MSYETIATLLTSLRSTTKRNEKISMLIEHANNPIVVKYLDHALNYDYVYRVQDTTLNKAKNTSSAAGGGDINRLFHMANMLATGEVSGNAAIAALSELFDVTDEQYHDVIECLLLKDLRAGVSVKTVNAAYKKAGRADNCIPVFDVMLADQWDKHQHKVKYPLLVQTKYDGLRVVARVSDNNTVQYYTRKGNIIPINFFDNHLTKDSACGWVFDGEVLMRNKTTKEFMKRKTANGIINSIMKGKGEVPADHELVFVLFDMVKVADFDNDTCNVPYEQRYEWLTRFANTVSDNTILPAEQSVANTKEEVLTKLKEHLDKGLEGIVVKEKTLPYRKKRMTTMLKLKAIFDMDMRIEAVVEGTGKYKGMLGSLICVSEDGLVRSSVGTGFSDEERQWFWDHRDEVIDKVVEVQYNETSENKLGEQSILHASYVMLRFDKD